MERNMYNIHEVSEILGLHEDSVRLNIRAGAIPAKKYGVQWMVKKSDLLSFLRKSYDILTERQRAWYDRETGGDIEENIRRIMRRTIETGATLESDRAELIMLKKALLDLYDKNIPKWLARLTEITAEEMTRASGVKCNLDLTLFQDDQGNFKAMIEPRIESGGKGNG